MMRARSRRGKGENGYALLMALFLGTMMVLAAMAVAPNVLTEGRREKEKEMIWRGKQYERGIKLYYRKMGKFPTSLEDLTKPQTGNIRFMRKAYKDPMNKEDGSWRLIYVGPSGQLIGSLKPPQTLQLPSAQGAQMGTPAATLAAGSQASGAKPQNGQQPTDAGTGQEEGTDANDTGNPANVPSGETPTIMGGNIIGVGSKVNKRSIMVYEKARNYRLFEFIWDPSKDTLGIGGTGTQIGTPAGATPGSPAPQLGGGPAGMPPGMNPMGPMGPPLSNPAPPSQPPTQPQP